MNSAKPLLVLVVLIASASPLPAQELRGLWNQVARQGAPKLRSWTLPSHRQGGSSQHTHRSLHHGFPWPGIVPIIGGGGSERPPQPVWMYTVYYTRSLNNWSNHTFDSRARAQGFASRLQSAGYRTFVRRRPAPSSLPSR